MAFIDKGYLLELCGQLMDGHISYGMGAKAKSLDLEPSQIKSIDCSGFTRYLIYKASGGQIKMVDGSDEQRDWCKKHGLRSQKYSEVAGLSDGCLRIAFIPRTYKNGKSVPPYGHVWLVMDGQTIESRGGKGPSRRSWSSSALTGRVNKCYILANLYSMTMGPITVT